MEVKSEEVQRWIAGYAGTFARRCVIMWRCWKARRWALQYLRKFLTGEWASWEDALAQGAVDRKALYHLSTAGLDPRHRRCDGLLELVHKTNMYTPQEMHRFCAKDLARWGLVPEYTPPKRFPVDGFRICGSSGYNGVNSLGDLIRSPMLMKSQDRRFWENQLAKHRRNWQKLIDKKAVYAEGEEPLYLLNQIEAEEEEIRKCEIQLKIIEGE